MKAPQSEFRPNTIRLNKAVGAGGKTTIKIKSEIGLQPGLAVEWDEGTKEIVIFTLLEELSDEKKSQLFTLVQSCVSGKSSSPT